jgi:hypothetical protein
MRTEVNQSMRAKSRIKIFAIIFVAAALLFSFNLSVSTKTSARAQETSAQAAKPKHISTGELAKLRWIEGTWRGTGDVEKPFYERYHFEDESTLVVEGLADETLSKVTDVTRFELKDGAFGNAGEGARWVATQLEDTAITFEPIARARNTFRWQRESKDVWKAILNWPATGDKPARQRVYLMERLPAGKQR